MADNVVQFKIQSEVNSLLEDAKEIGLEVLMFIGKKDGKIYVGSTELPDVSTALGDLMLVQQYIMGGYDAGL